MCFLRQSHGTGRPVQLCLTTRFLARRWRTIISHLEAAGLGDGKSGFVISCFRRSIRLFSFLVVKLMAERLNYREADAWIWRVLLVSVRVASDSGSDLVVCSADYGPIILPDARALLRGRPKSDKSHPRYR